MAAFLLPSFLVAQTLPLRFAKSGYSYTLSYTSDGGTIDNFHGNYTHSYMNPSTGQLLRNFVALQGGIDNHDASSVYFVNGSKLERWDAATRHITTLYTETSDFSSLGAIALSANESTLLISEISGTTGASQIAIFDLASKTVTGHVSLPASSYVYKLASVGTNQNLVLLIDGSTRNLMLFNLNGTNMGTFAGNYSNFTLDPTRTKVFVFDATSNNTNALDIQGGLSVLWSANNTGLTPTMKCSSDGQALLDQFGTLTNYVFGVWSAANGHLIRNALVYPSAFISFDVSPTTNEFVAAVSDGSYHIDKWSFNSSTGAVTPIGTLSEGVTTDLMPWSAGGTSNFLSRDSANSNSLLLRVETNGAVLQSSSLWSTSHQIWMSPDGQYYLRIGYKTTSATPWGINVHRASDGTLIAAFTWADATPGYQLQGPFWSSNNRILAYNASKKVLKCLAFSGTTISQVKSLGGVTADNLYFSADGTRAVTQTAGVTTVYDLDAGTKVGSFNTATANSLNVVESGISGNFFFVHEWRSTASGVENYVRIVDVTQSSLPVIGSGAIPQTDSPYYPGSLARVSPDGSRIALIGSAPYESTWKTDIAFIRTSDGFVLRHWTDPDLCASMTGFVDGCFTPDMSTFVLSSAYFSGGILYGIALPPNLGSSFTISPSSVFGGQSAKATVTLDRPAEPGGTVVQLSCDPVLGLAFNSVTVPGGQTSAQFDVGTLGVDADTTGNVYATLNGVTKSASLLVKAATTVTALVVAPNSVLAGASTTGTVSINASGGPSGTTVSLSSDKPYVVVPATVKIPYNSNNMDFTVTTSDPGATGTATITATFNGTTATATVQVKAVPHVTLTFNPLSIKGGNASELTVALDAPAPTGGTTFNLQGDSLLDPPAHVTIPAGKTSVAIGIRTKPTATTANGTLTISNADGPFKTATLEVQAPLLKTLSPGVIQVSGATSVELLLELDGPAPANFSLAASSSATGVATVPSTVTFTQNSHYAVVTVSVKKQSAKKTVKITVGGKSITLTALAEQ